MHFFVIYEPIYTNAQLGRADLAENERSLFMFLELSLATYFSVLYSFLKFFCSFLELFL